MRNLFSLQKLILLICAGLLSLTACGKGSSSKLQKIAIDPSWYPLDVQGRQRQIFGFSNELLQEIAHVRHITLARVDENWNNLYFHLIEGNYEGILSSLQPHNFNQNQYDFSNLYLLTGPVLVVPSASKVAKLELMSGKEVAVIQGTSTALILEKIPGIIIRTYESIPQALNDLAAGSIEGAVIDILSAEAYCNDLYNGQLKIATKPLTNDGLRLITLHDKAPSLIRDFNEGLKELQANGKYAALMKKWSLAK